MRASKKPKWLCSFFFFFFNIGFDSLQLLFWIGLGSGEGNCRWRTALINADSVPGGPAKDRHSITLLGVSIILAGYYSVLGLQ